MRYFFIGLLAILFPFLAFSRVPENIQEEVRYYRTQGYALQSKGDLKGALVYYQEAIKLDPLSYQVYNDLGVIYEDFGDRETAIKMYTKAIGLNPDYMPPYTNLALLYERSNDMLDAVYYWQKRYLFDKEEGPWRQQALQRILELELSKEVKREIIKGNVVSLEELKKIEEAKLHIDMGKQMASRGDYEKAVIELKKGLAIAPLDKSLQIEASQRYVQAKKTRDKERIRGYLQEALSSIEDDNYELVTQRLKDALSVLFGILE